MTVEILHPRVDAERIAALRAPGSGVRYVDGWIGIDADPALRGPAGGAFHPDDPASVERASRYVLFPWRRTLVRLPDSGLFHRVRTTRNRHLIDAGEQRRWRTARIGIAGLSVGGSVLTACALTGARRFRLTDPDTLALSNLNRLTASVCDLGAAKTELAERRVLELDPYAETARFDAGYRPELAAEFLGAGADSLSVLFEEMDDLPMKVAIRLQARERGIPVLMVTDNGDNVILDVERFDLDRRYPLFHGRAGDLGRFTEADLREPRTRAALATAIVGTDVTPRTRFSLSEVGRTLPTWPQLGTAAVAAGAFGAFAARMLVCGAELESGRYRLDLDRAVFGEAADRADRWNELGAEEFAARLRTG
ncbi:ThiF family adenylyltransferase [Nocardia sp. NPDC057227]|uniref:ThiF family adenylyltransferase n=1 Tax=Nocardia sp. NPDC057227 TaxID=3346056 RepID=UPI00364265C1